MDNMDLATLASQLPITTFWALDLVLLGVALFLVFAGITMARNSWKLWHIVTPPSVPMLGHIPWIVFGKPWQQFHKWAIAHGPLYRIAAWTTSIVIVSDPDAVKVILGKNYLNYHKDKWSYSVFSAILGNGLVTAEGRRHKLQRRRMAPQFHFQSLAALVPIFTRAAERMRVCMADVPAGQSFDIGALYRRITLEVISEASFGFSAVESGVLPRLFVHLLDEMNLRVWFPFRAFLPTPSNFRHGRMLKELNTIVRQIVSRRRAELQERGDDQPPAHRSLDLLDMLLAARVVDEDAPEGTPATGMTDDQLCDELKTMLLAGHETSSMALTWAVHLLVTNPAAMAKARQEVAEKLPAGNEFGTMQQYKSCAYLDAVLKEALRLYNPVPTITRQLVKDDVLCGKPIPAGTTVALNVWTVHHSKSVWGPDAEEFRPERFLGSAARGRHPFAFLAFSQGQRNCIGKNFALLEATILLATTIKHFDLAPDTAKGPVVTDGFVIPVRPKGGLHMTVQPRAAPAN